MVGIRQGFIGLFLAFDRLKRRSKSLQVRFARSASPTCKGCKSDLQILQVGLADILNRICRKLKPRFTLAKRSFRKIKRRVILVTPRFRLLNFMNVKKP